MTFGSSVSGFFSSVGGFFSNGYNTVKNKIVSVYEGASSIVSSVVHAPISIVKTVYSDIKSGISGANNTITHVIDKAHESLQKIVLHGEDKAADAVSSLSMPLVLGAGGFLLFMLSKK